MNGKRWYALRTTARAEKKVQERLQKIAIEHYLPLQTSIRLWSDRKKKVEVPLISGYIFVRTTAAELLQALFLPGVVAVVKENAIAVAIPDKQIENLRFMVENATEEILFTSTVLEEGQMVRINSGQLKGLIGQVTQKKGLYKVCIQLDYFGQLSTIVPIHALEVV